jgi:hypothetical protein
MATYCIPYCFAKLSSLVRTVERRQTGLLLHFSKIGRTLTYPTLSFCLFRIGYCAASPKGAGNNSCRIRVGECGICRLTDDDGEECELWEPFIRLLLCETKVGVHTGLRKYPLLS